MAWRTKECESTVGKRPTSKGWSHTGSNGWRRGRSSNVAERVSDSRPRRIRSWQDPRGGRSERWFRRMLVEARGNFNGPHNHGKYAGARLALGVVSTRHNPRAGTRESVIECMSVLVAVVYKVAPPGESAGENGRCGRLKSRETADPHTTGSPPATTTLTLS
ncbi:hypothetical protein FH972_021541 [Carpinus fangiana]|uniref:Uncharacterized protein n=1 Tax=Carpinus fangiana TaxID=176857 RepID=A0A5N6KQ74_9ROSI|nr:hypothetical protein FH972_021541 [Carpinus fangiana]